MFLIKKRKKKNIKIEELNHTDYLTKHDTFNIKLIINALIDIYFA